MKERSYLWHLFAICSYFEAQMGSRGGREVTSNFTTVYLCLPGKECEICLVGHLIKNNLCFLLIFHRKIYFFFSGFKIKNCQQIHSLIIYWFDIKNIYQCLISDKLFKHCTFICLSGTLSDNSDACATNKIYFGVL